MRSTRMNSLIEIVSQKSLIPVTEIQPDSDLFTELELDSLCFLEALVEIERVFGVKLNPANTPQSSVNTPLRMLAAIDASENAD
jgi:acyl carrier protein